jgi:DNA adenine methylase
VKKNPEYIIQEIEKFKKKFLHLNNEEKLKMCKDIVSKMDTYEGDTRTVNYLLMIYCSFTGCIILGNAWRTSSINANLYSKNQCHIFTENYRFKILELEKILKNVKIENKDYSEILKNTKSNDFVFLDPPYVEDKNYAFSYNNSENFSIHKLEKEVQKLDKKGVKWMMTQIDTSQVRELFKKYKISQYNNNSNFLNGKKNL